MVDISLEASHDFWSGFMDESVYRVIVLLESIETGLHDEDPAYEQSMRSLGDALDHIPAGFAKPERVLNVLAHIRTSRYLRILQAMDSAEPGSASKVIAHAEQSANSDASAQLFLQRNLIFERFRLLMRIFSLERLRTLTDALEE